MVCLGLLHTALSTPAGASISSSSGATTSRSSHMVLSAMLRGARTTTALPAISASTHRAALGRGAFCGGLKATTPSGWRCSTSVRPAYSFSTRICLVYQRREPGE